MWPIIPPCSGGNSGITGARCAANIASRAAKKPLSRGTDAGTAPLTRTLPSTNETSARGRQPTKLNRAQRSPCSTDSSKKPGWSPTSAKNALTGVWRSASTSVHTGTTPNCVASVRNSSRVGEIRIVNLRGTSRCLPRCAKQPRHAGRARAT